MSALATAVNFVAGLGIAEIRASRERLLCNAPKPDGTLCRFLTYGGKCPTHSLDAKGLKRRNCKVARSFQRNDPDAFTAQRKAAGRKGFEATGKMHGFERACEFARGHRLKHPSLCEQWAISILDDNGFAGKYEREFEAVLGDLRFADFKIGDCIIEVNRHAKTDEKVKWLEGLGYKVLVVSATEQDVLVQSPHAQEMKRAILQFLETNTPAPVENEIAAELLPF